MRTLALCVSLLALVACNSGPESAYPAAQQIISEIAENHTDLVRLSLHGRPEGQQETICLASTSAEKAGKPSDPEDVTAMTDGQVVELMEGENFDYTAPIKDENGVVFAAVGVTVSGADTDSMKASAEAIAGEVSRAIKTSTVPLW